MRGTVSRWSRRRLGRGLRVDNWRIVRVYLNLHLVLRAHRCSAAIVLPTTRRKQYLTTHAECLHAECLAISGVSECGQTSTNLSISAFL